MPTALMPFYGSTPVEAARLLCDWLTRAHARAAAPAGPKARCRIGRCHPFDAARGSALQRAPSAGYSDNADTPAGRVADTDRGCAQDAALPRVRLVATGGTISNRTGAG